MLKSIGVKNFRSLKEINICKKNVVDLKPLTMLLGKNSSGKSSFLRLFPLLKQSVSSRTRGVLAFFGDEVDFGDFDTTVSHESQEKKNDYIELVFFGCLDKLFNPYIFLSKRTPSSNESESSVVSYEINMKVQFDKKQDISYISYLSLKIYDNTITFAVEKNGTLKSFVVNGKNYIKDLKNIRVHYGVRRLGFPYFIEGDDIGSLSSPFLNLVKGKTGSTEPYSFREFSFFHECSLDWKDNIKKYFSKKRNISNKLFQKSVKEAISDENLFDDFYNKFVLFRFEEIYESIITDLCDVFQNVSYSKPLRANADRYYRSRFLSANEVNSDGSNLVDFFANLNESQQENLKIWMKDNFGFWYSIENSEGHKSIYIHECIKESENQEEVMHNITDMGFGFSQILPVVTQLWALIRNKRQQRNYRGSKANFIYAIEQPELHLHPAMQCKLFNSIAKVIDVAKQQNVLINFVIETHSETIINQIGRLIRRKKLSNEDTSVLIFSKEKPNLFTDIKPTPFDEEGKLEEWPVGFFGEEL